MLAVLTAVVMLANAPAAAPAKKAPEKAAAGEVIKRGAPLSGKTDKVAFADVAKAPASYTGKTVTIEGFVRQACTRKGCWMELSTGADKKAPGARVTFKDYGFFVPLDSAGSKATVEGTVDYAEMSAGEAEHLESEGATIPRGEDGKPREVRIVATGVELRR